MAELKSMYDSSKKKQSTTTMGRLQGTQFSGGQRSDISSRIGTSKKKKKKKEDEEEGIVIGRNNAVGFKTRHGGLQGVEFGGKSSSPLQRQPGKSMAKIPQGRNSFSNIKDMGKESKREEEEENPRKAALMRRLKIRKVKLKKEGLELKGSRKPVSSPGTRHLL